MIVTTLEEQPPNATHWSTRSMAAALGMSQSGISRIWRAFGLKPRLVESFKLSPDPQFIDKVRDVAGLYLNPPDAAVVLCVDEKTQIQALDRTAQTVPMMPGVPARQTHDYIRHGTTNLYAALDVASGCVITEMTPRHRAREFQQFLTLIDRSVPRELAVHVVLDNVSTHRTPAIQRWLQRHPRFTLHFTPTYSSWMNLVERWFAELTSKWLRRGTHHSVPDLIRSVEMWVASWNENPRPFIWHKSADQILDNLTGYLAGSGKRPPLARPRSESPPRGRMRRHFGADSGPLRGSLSPSGRPGTYSGRTTPVTARRRYWPRAPGCTRQRPSPSRNR